MMNKIFKVCTVLCLALAVVAVVMGIGVFTGRSYYIGIRIFNTVAKGGFMGFAGNVLSVVITALGFGALGYYGLKSGTDKKARSNGFVVGCIMSALCFVSAVFMLMNRAFTFGDLLVCALPLIYTFILFKTA